MCSCCAQVYSNKKRALTKAVNQAKKDKAAAADVAGSPSAPRPLGALAGDGAAIPGTLAGGPTLHMAGAALGHLPPPGAVRQYPPAGVGPPPAPQGAGVAGIGAAAIAAVQAQVC